MTTSGVYTEYLVPSAGGRPELITAGPDGSLWFTEDVGNRVGRVTTSGAFTLYSLPTADSVPLGIAAGPDGNLWISEVFGNKVARVTTSGVINEFSRPAPLFRTASRLDRMETTGWRRRTGTRSQR